MLLLKKCFLEEGFVDVVTYINSGNVIFSSEIKDISLLITKIQEMIKENFNLIIPVFVISILDLKEIYLNIPNWVDDNKEIYDNVIFIIPPITYMDVYNEIGPAKEEYEKIHNYKNVIFWSFYRKYYSKTNWIKTASSKINDEITIRTVNTIKKIIELSEKGEK